MQLLLLIPAYLLGSIPFGYITARKVKKIDIREHGSCNVGATNVFRVVGKKWGILVFSLDVAKGYAATCLPFLFETGEIPFIAIYCGVAAILGHTFPVWLKWRGGKGVATSLGVFLGVAFLPTLIVFVGWIFVFSLSRIISLASLFAAAVFPILIFVFYKGTASLKILAPISLLLAAFIFYTHRSNISRLLKGEEKKII